MANIKKSSIKYLERCSVFDFFVDLFQELSPKSFRYQVDSGRQIVVEGYKNILKIDDCNVVVKLFDGELEISGENLHVLEFGTNTIKIVGKIFCVSTRGVKDEK